MSESQKNGLSSSFNLAESIDSAAPKEDDVLPDAVAAAKRAMGKVEKEKERLEYEATHDPLTGLLNRRGFEEKFTELRQSSKKVGLLSLDLDGLKLLNDTKGHAKGDAALVRLAKVVRVSDIVARTGGDEILIAVDLEVKENERRGQVDMSEKERLDAVQEKVQKTIYEDPELQELGVGASIGSVLVDPSKSMDESIHLADQAMYEQKRQRKAGGEA